MTETTDRTALRQRIEDHLRRYGAESSRIVDVFAKAHDMHPTDFQALVLIMNAERQGEPATPGSLRHGLGITSGAVTGTVDRLVESGHVRREPDPQDRRQVRLRWGGSGQALAYEFFAPLGRRMDAIVSGFETEQLQIIEQFMCAMTEAMIEHRSALDQLRPRSG